MCASTGNTSAAAAAYAARAPGLDCVVLLTQHGVALGKLSTSALSMARRSLPLRGHLTTPCAWSVRSPRTYPLALVNSVNPFRIESQTPVVFEICDALGDTPD